MPSLAVDHVDPGIGVLLLEPAIPPRAIQLIRKRGRTLLPAAEQFRTVAAEVANELLAR